MLSSGTLNLKFMQRNNNAKNQDTKPKTEPNSSTPNLQEATVDLTKGNKRRVNNVSSSSVDLHQNPTPKWTIIYEESLIHFPFLYPTSRPSVDTILPVHLGRKSFGHSSKSSQKTDQPTSQNKRAKLDSSTSQKTEKHSKKLKIESQNSAKAYESHQAAQTQIQSSSTSAERISIREDEKSIVRDVSGRTGFQKPFGSTTIKSKRRNSTIVNSTSEPQPNSHIDCPEKSGSGMSVAVVGRDVPHQTADLNIKPHYHESILISDNESDQSDDTEMVKNQIEMMFKEARKAQVASTG